ncbi:ion channel CASTOR-like [Pistacia vera]|uniref:ion channel CASTOR-like n=1 Tax=Pistacia vera TaxID=55513 RepID=UPI0012635599|nr:ion channel CASTOR-like [Pistacia vera]
MHSNYAGLRKRASYSERPAEPPKREEIGAVSDGNAGISGEKTGEENAWFSGPRVKVRWLVVISLAIVIASFSSLVHKNFSLQEHVSKLNTRLQACNLSDSIDVSSSISDASDQLPRKGLKNLAIILLLTLLSIPVLILKYTDYVSRSRSSDNIPEEFSLTKQLAYRLDIVLSIYSYAKPLALLLASLLLICFGGLALSFVTDDGLADCLWLSWTYVADSGSHASSEGIGPRLVSVSISFGGMIIFATMLGLVSDSISEKLDSLRKGRSEVVEQNHTLILGGVINW